MSTETNKVDVFVITFSLKSGQVCVIMASSNHLLSLQVVLFTGLTAHPSGD